MLLLAHEVILPDLKRSMPKKFLSVSFRLCQQKESSVSFHRWRLSLKIRTSLGIWLLRYHAAWSDFAIYTCMEDDTIW
jgi:hypothetical protein